ncbi:hypothetical protein Gogos_000105 [Gossypium gossypioides]|uniref:Response regulatory domain-containing protein n=1 Tax=Gossypium gossypioides TaxID=34282 RepID=A0A7J9D0D9_GOSGO|nr:hypothetical protein [Gossypium gossypioides]
MLDMDAFKLLELVGLEMDLPIIMLSAHGDTKLVKKGGTCDYLLKPVHIEELKNIWQHVKYRLYLGLNSVVALGSKDPSYLRKGEMLGD